MTLPAPTETPRTLKGARLAGIAVLTAFAALALGCIWFLAEAGQRDAATRVNAHREVSAAAAYSVTQPLARGDLAGARTALTAFERLSNLNAIHAYDSADHEILSWRSSRQPSASPGDNVITPLAVSGRTVGRLDMVFASDGEPGLAWRATVLGAALLLSSAGFGILFGAMLTSKMLKPLKLLAQSMRDIGEAEAFRAPTPPKHEDHFEEITQVIEAFYDLLARLDERQTALRIALETLAKDRDAAVDANQTKSEFLANISHEIRTPLNGVLSMVEIIQTEPLSPLQSERLAVVRKSGEALLTVVNDVLDLSRIEAGQLVLALKAFRPSDLAQEVIASFTAMAQAKGLELRHASDTSAQTWRMGDAARVRQVLSNLVSNAIKFTTEGFIEVRVGGAEGEFRMSVIDTGRGVARDLAPLLFKKFSQLTPHSPEAVEGAGLGLSICHDLCTLMGGTIWTDLDRARGAAFHVVLPLQAAPASEIPRRRTDGARTSPKPTLAMPPRPTAQIQALDVSEPVKSNPPPLEAAEPEAEPELGVLRVLAAEDNTTNRLVLEAMIGILGYAMDIVMDGQAAVDAWSQTDYDVILMDIQMPILDGLGATREIRAREAASGRARTPIIAVSANAMNHQVSDYLSAGMDAHVPKPIELTRLHAAIESAMNGVNSLMSDGDDKARDAG